MSNKNEKTTLFDTIETSSLKNKSELYAYLIVPILVTLIFIEAFRAFVPGIYAAMYHVVFQDPGWIGSLMTLLTLILLFIPLFTSRLSKHFGQKKIYLISIIGIAIMRLLMAFHLSSLLQTVLAGLIIAFYGFFISIFLKRLIQNDLGMDLKAKISIFSISIIAAFLIDMVLRTIGFSSDISLISIHLTPETWYILQYIWLIAQVPLSLLLIWFTIRTTTVTFPDISAEKIEDKRNEPWILNATGFGMFLFLMFNVFLYPNAIAEYTNTNYAIINPILMGALTLILIYLLFGRIKMLYNFKINICFNLILILALGGFLFLGTTWVYPIAILMTLAITIIFLDLHLLITNASITPKNGNQLKSLSKFFSYGSLLYIIMTIFHVFSTDYAFTITAFAGLGPLILFIGGCLLVLTTLLANLQLNKFKEGGAA
ncbi:MAG TPA: hypothetical protein VMV49_05605 [Candidatus Deferrimicrobium sp.]|nr:hypothetical protein [Candidatus Deferrimicrobium sp.]